VKIKKYNGRFPLNLVAAAALSVVLITGGAIGVFASPGEYDLTAPGSSATVTGTIGGDAIFEVFNPDDPSGSGVFDPFVRISTNNPVEKGYNTDYRKLQFDENNSPTFTKSYLVNDIPMVEKGGILYREFQLDINQNTPEPNRYLSLDKFQLWLTDVPDLHNYDYANLEFPLDATMIWELAQGDWFKLDYTNNEGSGKRDLRALVPDEIFTDGDYVVLFSEFGDNWPNNDGYEEWGVALYPATKSGHKFNDLNANGVWDQGELGLEGWTITLAGSPNKGQAINMSTTTDADGAYSFSVPPGTYTVSEEVKEGWSQSYPGGDGTYTVTLGNGQLERDNDFGNFQQATKSGHKFHDLNADGDQDQGELGLEGWTINLDGTDGQGNAVNLSTQTDANGDYSFQVNPGSYSVTETIPAGWYQSTPGTPQSPDGYNITLTSGQTDSDNDFGNFRQATKSGHKFHDLDADGVWDQGELGLEGWTINLDGTDGQNNAVNLNTQTDANGAYSFTVNPGSYIVTETIPAGWYQSKPGTPQSPAGYNITLTSGQTDSDNDFGNFQQATKSGRKFHDLNANGALDQGEPGLAGWTINLDGTDGQNNVINLNTLTDVNGAYSFTVNPGSYIVTETIPADWYQSKPGTPQAPAGYNITLTSGETDSDNDFGNFQKATKSGHKFNDLNADGVWDQGELGLEDWTITLIGNDGLGNAVNLNTQTDVNGAYSFTVNPGSYSVTETIPADWYQSKPGTPQSPAGYNITLISGQTDSDNDFGNFQNADLVVTKTGTITYTIRVTNDGPSTAVNVVVDDDLPGDLEWEITSAPAGFAITDNHLHGTLASLASGAYVEITVEATIEGHADNPMLPNTAEADSDTHDPDTGNNSDDADIGQTP
jgi:uncharacterized repeat protein (TIGR01451 family)